MHNTLASKRSVLIHYSEIGLKGGNRKFFERIFRENLLRTLSGTRHDGLQWRRGRFVLDLRDDSDTAAILRRLARVPGVQVTFGGAPGCRFAPSRCLGLHFPIIGRVALVSDSSCPSARLHLARKA